MSRTRVSSAIQERPDHTGAPERPRLDEEEWSPLEVPAARRVWGPAVEIDVAGEADGDELVESLWRQGLPAALREHAAGWRVEVSSPREGHERLLADVKRALRTWLADAGRAARLR